MIDPGDFLKTCLALGMDSCFGVPDSLLKDLGQVFDEIFDERHVIAANEGNALALAAGHYVATSRPGLVYLQNSGLGNLINPLLSLTDPCVYSIPALILIGWRGEPGKKDEPQHQRQGAVSCALLETLDVPYAILDANSDYTEIVHNAFRSMTTQRRPFAILVKSGTFAGVRASQTPAEQSDLILREQALEAILNGIGAHDIVISTTGKTSREVYEIRSAKGVVCTDFLCVGSMGHASSIALGAALSCPKRQVICLDGDGALIMHMGSLAIIGQMAPNNLIHILINNQAHESVGGQPTAASSMDFKKLSEAVGYRQFHQAFETSQITAAISESIGAGPSLIEVRVSCGSRPNLGRPTQSPLENINAVMDYIAHG